MAIKDDMEDVQEAVINELITDNGLNPLSITDGTVTLAKLGSDVDLGQVNDGAVTTAKIDNGAVTPAKLSQAYLPLTGGSLTGNADLNGDLDVDGTTNLDAVDIDGAVDMASTLQVDGVLTTTATTVFNGGFVSNANSTVNPTGGVITLGANGHITSKQSLDVATAGGRFIGQSNRGELGNIGIEQTANSTDGGYIRFSTAPSGSTTSAEHMRIQNNGSVGINVDNPNSFNSGAYNLVVGSPSAPSQGITIAADTNSIMYFADGTSGAEQYMGSIIYNHADNEMTFRTNGFNSALVIDENQHVILSNVPTSASGLTTGTIYSDGGTLKIV